MMAYLKNSKVLSSPSFLTCSSLSVMLPALAPVGSNRRRKTTGLFKQGTFENHQELSVDGKETLAIMHNYQTETVSGGVISNPN